VDVIAAVGESSYLLDVGPLDGDRSRRAGRILFHRAGGWALGVEASVDSHLRYLPYARPFTGDPTPILELAARLLREGEVRRAGREGVVHLLA
jgi:hypothetical protein